MKYLIKKLFQSAYNFSLFRSLYLNFKINSSFRIRIFIGKKTKFFINNADIKITKPVYFDCRNSGQFWHDSTIVLDNNSTLEIGSNVNFYSGAQIKLFENSTLKIGENTYFSGPIVIHSKDFISIGKSCSISWNVTIIDSDFHAINDDDTILSSPVKIGNNVWIGNNVTILKGVNIGDNSIVAAGSIVTKSIGVNEIFAGNPAKLIRKKNG